MLLYHLVNIQTDQKAMEITIFNRQIHYKWAIFNSNLLNRLNYQRVVTAMPQVFAQPHGFPESRRGQRGARPDVLSHRARTLKPDARMNASYTSPIWLVVWNMNFIFP